MSECLTSCSAVVSVLGCGNERVKDVHCRLMDEISHTQATTVQHDLDVFRRALVHTVSTSGTAESSEVSGPNSHFTCLTLRWHGARFQVNHFSLEIQNKCKLCLKELFTTFAYVSFMCSNFFLEGANTYILLCPARNRTVPRSSVSRKTLRNENKPGHMPENCG